jgi:hypothetical protein
MSKKKDDVKVKKGGTNKQPTKVSSEAQGEKIEGVNPPPRRIIEGVNPPQPTNVNPLPVSPPPPKKIDKTLKIVKEVEPDKDTVEPTKDKNTSNKKVSTEFDNKEEVKSAPTPMEMKNIFISSAIDDCMAVIADYKKIKETRNLNILEVRSMFDTYYQLAEIFLEFGSDKNQALIYISNAIEIGAGRLDLNTISTAFRFRGRIKVIIAQLIQGV